MPNRPCRVGASALLLPLLATGMVLGAQDVEGLRGRFTIPIGAATRAPILRGVPGATSTTPLAFGASWGDAFIGAGYQGSTRGVARPGEPQVAGMLMASPFVDGLTDVCDDRLVVRIQVATTPGSRDIVRRVWRMLALDAFARGDLLVPPAPSTVVQMVGGAPGSS